MASLATDTTALWTQIHDQATAAAAAEPILSAAFRSSVLDHSELSAALAAHLAPKLAANSLTCERLVPLMREAYADPTVAAAICRDLQGVVDRDPAVSELALAFLYYKGFHAIESYRVANWLWQQGRRSLALYLQNRISEVLGVDIHPAARIGADIFMDHATGVVIGETAVVEDGVSMLHEVTLGGTGKESGDRHPKVRKGVLLGAGAKILGNVEIGEGAKVAACSVVLEDVPPHVTVAGIPARIVGRTRTDTPSQTMDHRLPRLDVGDGI